MRIDNVKVGTAYVTIVGKGGREITPGVKVYYIPDNDYNKKVLLKKNSVYKLTCYDNKNIGKGKITITKKSDYFEGIIYEGCN